MQISFDAGAFVIAIIFAMAWLFRLEAKTNRATEMNIELKKNLDDAEKETEKVEYKVIASIEAMKTTMLELTLQVTRMMERVEHMNKKMTDLQALGLKEFLKD
jgi:cbb3-type cytochrome oxidase subunit 3